MNSAFQDVQETIQCKKHAILTFGGEGKRFGWIKPKQFYPLEDGRTLLEYVVEKFLSFEIFKKIIVVSPRDYLEETKAVLSNLQPFSLGTISIIIGGETREYSVWNAINFLKDFALDEDIVVIHDGARPLISKEIIFENMRLCEECGAVVTAINSTDTVSYSESGVEIDEMIPRSKIYLHQTPQTFRYDIIRTAMETNLDRLDLFSDDASIVFSTGGKIHYVKGSTMNIKITTIEDMDLFSYYSKLTNNKNR